MGDVSMAKAPYCQRRSVITEFQFSKNEKRVEAAGSEMPAVRQRDRRAPQRCRKRGAETEERHKDAGCTSKRCQKRVKEMPEARQREAGSVPKRHLEERGRDVVSALKPKAHGEIAESMLKRGQMYAEERPEVS